MEMSCPVSVYLYGLVCPVSESCYSSLAAQLSKYRC